ncbi:MAG TPA: glycosyltransferase family 4 protein, partial [Acetobacteraceae bacterium]|nr:glycosyltransferase family 4 protein [Acetobacteraceae bacterium]
GPEPEADQTAAARAVPGLRLLPTGLPLDWLAETPAEVEAASLALSALAAEAGADLAHLHSPALAAGAGFTVPVAASCHSCVGTWWDTVRGGPLPPDFAWRARLVARGCARADALLAPTAAFAEATARFYGLAEPPTVIRNGRRPPPPPARPAPERRRAPPVAFTAGRLWDEGKNLRAIDRAAGRLAGSVPVLAAGPTDGPAGARIALHHARPLGRLRAEEIARRLAERPIFVSAARYEPFGLSVLEAAQAGCALVLSDIPSFRELWDGAADFVPADDDRALAAAVERAARDPARLGAAAQRRAERYTVEAMASGTSALYRALLRRAATAASPEETAAA